MNTSRQAAIDKILDRIDEDAANGWCSNWAEIKEGPVSLTVTFADGTHKNFTIPRESA